MLNGLRAQRQEGARPGFEVSILQGHKHSRCRGSCFGSNAIDPEERIAAGSAEDQAATVQQPCG